MWKHIETYIETHRSDLDRDTPPPGIWNKIEEELEADQRTASAGIARFGAFDNWIRLAAAVVLILGGAWLWVRVMPEQTPRTTTASLLPAVHIITDAGAEWEEAEANYVEEITLITAKLATGWESSELYHQLRPEIARLEEELNDIRKAHADVLHKDSLLNELKRKQSEHLEALRRLLTE